MQSDLDHSYMFAVKNGPASRTAQSQENHDFLGGGARGAQREQTGKVEKQAALRSLQQKGICCGSSKSKQYHNGEKEGEAIETLRCERKAT
eukprot:1160897-Pelagomonas_calceolata.AAC.11